MIRYSNRLTEMRVMRNRILLFASIIVIALSICSCRKADELPPLNEGYATKFILPDGVNLTSEERDYLEELDQEYQDATK